MVADTPTVPDNPLRALCTPNVNHLEHNVLVPIRVLNSVLMREDGTVFKIVCLEQTKVFQRLFRTDQFSAPPCWKAPYPRVPTAHVLPARLWATREKRAGGRWVVGG